LHPHRRDSIRTLPPPPTHTCPPPSAALAVALELSDAVAPPQRDDLPPLPLECSDVSLGARPQGGGGLVESSDDEGDGPRDCAPPPHNEFVGAGATVSDDEGAAEAKGGEVVLNQAAVAGVGVANDLLLGRFINSSSATLQSNEITKNPTAVEESDTPPPPPLEQIANEDPSAEKQPKIRFSDASLRKRTSYFEYRRQSSATSLRGAARFKDLAERVEDEAAVYRSHFWKALLTVALMISLLAALAAVVGGRVRMVQLDGDVMGSLLETQDLLIDMLPPPLCLVDAVPKVFDFITARWGGVVFKIKRGGNSLLTLPAPRPSARSSCWR
jgi:hypothetical protein